MLDAVAGIDVADRAVGEQALDRGVDLLPQRRVGAAHADGDVPRQLRLLLVGMDQRSDLGSGMASG